MRYYGQNLTSCTSSHFQHLFKLNQNLNESVHRFPLIQGQLVRGHTMEPRKIKRFDNFGSFCNRDRTPCQKQTLDRTPPCTISFTFSRVVLEYFARRTAVLTPPKWIRSCVVVVITPELQTSNTFAIKICKNTAEQLEDVTWLANSFN